MNRRVRTRTHGGVGGREGRPSLPPDFKCARWSYLQNNAHRMRYDEYLAAGYPIASGVIEGACRQVVKDRMERSGMRWTIESAQAMLDVRSTYVNGDWDAFMAYRIEQETQRLYPYRELVEPIDMPEGIEMPIAA
jgi:hypothetical protein